MLEKGEPEGTANEKGYSHPGNVPEERTENTALVALLRLLLREPPPGHDFDKCPICKRFGITKI